MVNGSFLTASTKISNYLIFPRFLLMDSQLKLNETEKILYVLLFDRARLSMTNLKWQDEDGHVFLCYSIEELSKDLSKSESTIKNALSSLERQGLIVRKRQGLGKANHIYVLLPVPTDKKPSDEKQEICLSDRQNTGDRKDKMVPSNKNNSKIKTTEQEHLSKSTLALGCFRNVVLTPGELTELQKEIPGFETYVEKLSTYMASTGKTYRNHAATIRSWALRDHRSAPERSYEYEEGESL